MKKIILGVLLVLSNFCLAQNDHRMSEQERLMMPSYLKTIEQSINKSSAITPPTSPVRTIGEWEELQGLLIGWKSYPSILREIVRAAKLETRVYIVYSSPDNPTSLTNYLNAGGVDTINVTFLGTGLNSVWCRDYGPWSVYTNDVDSLLTIDWIYNRPRPLDDGVPVAISNTIGTPLFQTTSAPWNLIHTGGNFMTDGQGTGFSSNLILDENPSLTNAQVDTIMNRFMGINRYIKMTILPYDAIHHIDMHMKLLDEETLLVGQYPPGIADGPQIEANLLYVLSNFNSIYGTPYKVIRIPMPDDNGAYPNSTGDYYTYTNSSFINKTVIVPTYGISEDADALQTYRDALPGYNVVGINSSLSIPALGALHCITKEIGSSDPLLIVHQALTNTNDTINDYAITAKIQHRSGIQSATIYYRTDTTSAYISIPMSVANGNNFTGSIPAQQAGTTVYYYVEATAISGKTNVRPLPAPAGYWHFDVTGTTSLNEEQNSVDQLNQVFPNPAKGITCIPISLSKNSNINLQLIDVTGRIISTITNKYYQKGDHKIFLDASNYDSGLYFIQMITDKTKLISPLVIR
jgi:agmatine deiminase